MQLNEIIGDLYDFLAVQEGVSYKPYLCSAGKITIGVGHVVSPVDDLGAYKGKEIHDFLVRNNIPRTASLCYKPKDIKSVNNRLKLNFDDITHDKVMELFNVDITHFYLNTLDLVRPIMDTMDKNKLIAITSLIYNVGAGNFAKSRSLKFLIGGNLEGFAVEFLDFNKAGGKYSKGLYNRRVRELNLFFGEKRYIEK